MRLVLVGAGGHCLSCLEVARSAGIEVAGIVAPEAEPSIYGITRLGDDAWLDTPTARQFEYLIAVGQVNRSPMRQRLYEGLVRRGMTAAKVVASSTVVATDVRVGAGTVIMHRAVLNAGATVGVNAIINTGAILEHGVKIGNHCHISTGATVNGDAEIGAGTIIGSGAIILQCVTIAADVIVGAGAVVVRNITEAGTWVGVPARRVK